MKKAFSFDISNMKNCNVSDCINDGLEEDQQIMAYTKMLQPQTMSVVQITSLDVYFYFLQTFCRLFERKRPLYLIYEYNDVQITSLYFLMSVCQVSPMTKLNKNATC